MMDIQNQIISKVGTDKLMHFFAGGWVSCLLTSNVYCALAIGLFLGLGKELLDKHARKGSFDVKDWLATFLGGAATALCLLIGKYIHL